MTDTQLVSVKIPKRLLRLMPPAGKGRSRFIIGALEEKLSQPQVPHWNPQSERGRRLVALLNKGERERGPILDAEGISRELAERRGKWH